MIRSTVVAVLKSALDSTSNSVRMRLLSSAAAAQQSANEHFKLLIVGGGTAGAATSNKFGPFLGPGKVAVLEPSELHFYQAGWTMVGGGMRDFAKTVRNEGGILNKNCTWIKEGAAEFDPNKCTVVTETGRVITYDYLLLATGLQLRYDLIKGLPEAFETPGVCSNYHRDHVKKTFPILQNFKGGNAIFTFPNTPIKCAGAPQKICYISEEYLRKSGVRDKTTVMYNTSLPVIFGIKKYADVLMEIVKRRDIKLNVRHNLVEVKPDTREAVFDILDENALPTGKQATWKYDMLHVGPPCSPIEPLRNCPSLTDAKGWVDVDSKTLQHKRYPNVFAAGDCTNTPNAKTAAAISAQMEIIRKNLRAVMAGKPVYAEYDGYASCPLVTGYKSCIMAEFCPEGPMETFPINQSRESYLMFLMKKEFMPILYWNYLVTGWWEGPKYFRRAFHLGLRK